MKVNMMQKQTTIQVLFCVHITAACFSSYPFLVTVDTKLAETTHTPPCNAESLTSNPATSPSEIQVCLKTILTNVHLITFLFNQGNDS